MISKLFYNGVGYNINPNRNNKRSSYQSPQFLYTQDLKLFHSKISRCIKKCLPYISNNQTKDNLESLTQMPFVMNGDIRVEILNSCQNMKKALSKISDYMPPDIKRDAMSIIATPPPQKKKSTPNRVSEWNGVARHIRRRKTKKIFWNAVLKLSPYHKIEYLAEDEIHAALIHDALIRLYFPDWKEKLNFL